MIHINSTSLKIQKAKDQFEDEMLNFVFKRFDKLLSERNPSYEFFLKVFDKFIIKDLHTILIGKPEDLIKLHYKYLFLLGLNDFIEPLKYVFNYDSFIVKTKKRYNAYDLVDSLDINCCPYCNRNYISTIISNKNKLISRAQLDHFFDKGTHPILAISFFNLVPSCDLCNTTLKGKKHLNLEEYLHPYLDDYINDIKFIFKYDNRSKNRLRIEFKQTENLKFKNNKDLFQLEEIYQSHSDQLDEMIRLKKLFNDNYLSILSKNLLKNTNISQEELYRLAFGTELQAENFSSRPLSKFKYDFLKSLNIIK